MDEDDIINTKRGLYALGHYRRPKHGITPYADLGLVDGIRSFQRDGGLRVDGVMKSDGPTHRKLNSTLDYMNSSQSRNTVRQQSLAAVAYPAIIYKIAEYFVMSIATAWAWWQAMSSVKKEEVRRKVERAESGDTSGKDCEYSYQQVDIPTCRAIARKRGIEAGRRCYASASERYAACRRGVPKNQWPPLDTWNN